MDEKFNQKYENQIILLAQNRIENGNYKVFDYDARVITRKNFPDLVRQGKTDSESCLIVTNREGETLVITQEFARTLFNALNNGL